MKDAERKQVMVTMYCVDEQDDVQEIPVRLTRLVGGVWYITERKWFKLLKDYKWISFQNPNMYTVTRLPEYVQRVIVLHKDKTGHEVYTDPAIN